MAHANRKKFGAGQQDQGKGKGTGGMSPAEADPLPGKAILSNRDTSRHSDQRGLDSRHVRTEQQRDYVGNQTGGEAVPDDAADEDKLADERPEGDGEPPDPSAARKGQSR